MASWSRFASRGVLTAVLALYTVYAVGPMIWLAAMSLRTTSEINLSHYALPSEFHWEKFARAWFNSSYDTYFWNSVVVVGVAVVVVTLVGSTAAFCLARYRFPGNRLIFPRCSAPSCCRRRSPSSRCSRPWWSTPLSTR